MNNLPYLNLGCGGHFDNRWVNVDFSKTGENVIAHNLLNGIPFDSNTFEVVYHSHVLEHFPKKEAKQFIEECYRVLKPGGILRIAVPDLETIAKNYLRLIESGKADPANKKIRADYDWTMIEMYDQVVRNSNGGEMVNYLSDKELLNEDFVITRIGYEGQVLRQLLLNTSPSQSPKKSFFQMLSNNLKRVMSPRSYKTLILKTLLKRDYQLLQFAKFKLSGEIHQWMYDFYSLRELLRQTGFNMIAQKEYNTSNIPNWASFKLDEKNDKARKPDSLFVEAIK